MKLVIGQDTLNDALSKVSRAVSASAANGDARLGYIKAQAANDTITLTGSNGETTISVKAKCGVEKPFGFLAPASVFTRFVASLPYGSISIEKDAEKQAIKLVSYETTTTFRSPALEMPNPNDCDECFKMSIPKAVLHEMLRKTMYAVAKDDVRKVINNLLFRVDGRKITLAATNGRLLTEIVFESKDIKVSDDIALDFVVPLQTCAILYDNNMFPDDRAVEITTPKDPLERNYVIFASSGITLRTKILCERYPMYEKVIPAPSDNVAKVAGWGMIEAVNRASIFSPSGDSGYVSLKFKKNELLVSSQDSEFGKCKDTVKIKYDGEEAEMYIAKRYIVPVLKSIDDNVVDIHIYHKERPMIMVTCSLPFRAVIMPMVRA